MLTIGVLVFTAVMILTGVSEFKTAADVTRGLGVISEPDRKANEWRASGLTCFLVANTVFWAWMMYDAGPDGVEMSVFSMLGLVCVDGLLIRFIDKQQRPSVRNHGYSSWP